MKRMSPVQPSRREAFRAGLAGVAAIGLGAACGDAKPSVEANGRAIPREVLDSDAYGLSLGRFTPHVGTAFRFGAPNGEAVELTLASATDRGVGGRPIVDKGECFSLSFVATGAMPPAGLAQDTYTVSHPMLGAFSLFIVPASPSGAQSYTALFNRV